MKLHLVSDLHEDLWLDRAGLSVVDAIPAGRADVLVVASDLLELAAFEQRDVEEPFRKLRDKADEVVYVYGNHEFYGRHVLAVKDRLGEICARLGIRVLDDAVVEIRGQRFVGSTLWYDPTTREARFLLKDWSDSSILGFWEHVPVAHRAGVEFLKASVRKGDVVVTHMLPSHESVPGKYKGVVTNVFFVTSLDMLIKFAQPALWLHGHTHDASDYKLHRTRVVCSPIGYPHEMHAIGTKVLERRFECVVEV